MLLSMQLAAAEDAFELNGVYYTDHTDSIIYTYIHNNIYICLHIIINA